MKAHENVRALVRDNRMQDGGGRFMKCALLNF